MIEVGKSASGDTAGAASTADDNINLLWDSHYDRLVDGFDCNVLSWSTTTNSKTVEYNDKQDGIKVE